jgi:hypothetical protein
MEVIIGRHWVGWEVSGVLGILCFSGGVGDRGCYFSIKHSTDENHYSSRVVKDNSGMKYLHLNLSSITY